MDLTPEGPPRRAWHLYRKLRGRFDGNLSETPWNWLFPSGDFTEITDEALDELMGFTIAGNLGWVIFPPAGYRL